MSTHAQLQELDHLADSALQVLADLQGVLYSSSGLDDAARRAEAARLHLADVRRIIEGLKCDRAPCDRVDGKCQRCAPVPL
jgi:hypothetical protein